MSLDILGFALGQRLKDLLKPAAAPEGSIFYLYGAPAKTRTIYNGMELPELPEWDKETYPYVHIRNYNDTITVMCTPVNWQYGIYTASNKQYTRLHIHIPAGEKLSYLKFDLSDDGWGSALVSTVDRTTSTTGAYLPTLGEFWTNTDIPNIDNNTVYLAASEPVTIPMSNPAMAVYGGEELPPLPEWDKTAYPYAYIYRNAAGVVRYELHPTSLQYGTFTYSGTQYTVVHYFVEAGKSRTYLRSELTNGAWGELTPVTNNRTNSSTGYYGGYQVTLLWAFRDLPNVDNGTTYFAASDPICINNANIALADGDGYVMYNGAVLPPLPKWDKVNYPYAYVYAVNDYFLLVTKDRPSVYGAVNIDGEIMYKTYSTYSADESIKHMNSKCENGVWSKPYEVTQNNTVTGDAKFFLWAEGEVFWSNFDVINEADGTIYNAACAPISLVSNEPVAAVYGDLQMPVLPEWDKTAYPYAHMTAVGKLSCMPSPIKYGTYTANSTKYTKVYFEVAPGSVYKFIQFSAENGAWGSPKEVTVDRSTSTSGYYGSFASCIWANTNVPNVDTGNTYLFASDPIHVYEEKE